MKVIIPAAIITPPFAPYIVPKRQFLLPIAGKPIISHIIDGLSDLEVDSLTMIVNEGPPLPSSVFGLGDLYNKLKIVNQPSPKGVAEAILKALEDNDEDVLVNFGDTILGDPMGTITCWQTSAFAVKKVDDPGNWGTVKVDRNGFITRIWEKDSNSDSNLAMIGVYFFKKVQEFRSRLIEQSYLNSNNPHSFSDAIDELIKRGHSIKAVEVNAWHDTEHHQNLLSTNKFLINQYHRNIKMDIHWKQRYPDTFIVHPVFIDPNVEIHNSIIGPNVSIANDSSISNSIIINSVIGENVTIERALLNDSIFGTGSSFSGQFNKMDLPAGTAINAECKNIW